MSSYIMEIKKNDNIINIVAKMKILTKYYFVGNVKLFKLTSKKMGIDEYKMLSLHCKKMMRKSKRTVPCKPWCISHKTPFLPFIIFLSTILVTHLNQLEKSDYKYLLF